MSASTRSHRNVYIGHFDVLLNAITNNKIRFGKGPDNLSLRIGNRIGKIFTLLIKKETKIMKKTTFMLLFIACVIMVFAIIGVVGLFNPA